MTQGHRDEMRHAASLSEISNQKSEILFSVPFSVPPCLRVTFLLLMIPFFLATGCANEPKKEVVQPPKPVDLANGASLFPRDSSPRDARPEPLLLVNLTVYRMLVPARS